MFFMVHVREPFGLKRLTVGLGFAAMERSKCLIGKGMVDLLLKSNISTLDNQVYGNEDMELVVKHYLGFLCACANQTNRWNPKLVAPSAKEVFGCHDFVAKKFGEALASVLSYCYNTAGKATSGTKTQRNRQGRHRQLLPQYLFHEQNSGINEVAAVSSKARSNRQQLRVC